MTDEPKLHEHEEKIEPISPGFGAQAAATRSAFEPVKSTDRQTLWLVAGGLALVVALVGVFFVLPRWMSAESTSGQSRSADNVAAETALRDSKPTLSPEQMAALEADIQRDLARLLTQQEEIESMAVETWGGDNWNAYQAESRDGDDAYLAHDYEAAARAYTEALRLGDALLEEAGRIVSTAMNDAQSALDAEDWRTALEQFNVVLRIEPANVGAESGRQRAERLPRVLDLVREGKESEDNGELPSAITAYRAALDIDRDWQPAREALRRAESNLAQYEFDQVLSKGYAALGEKNYRDAIEHFDEALQMRPGSSEASDGLFQAEEGLRLGQIALAEVRALAFERRELWPQAIEQYRATLDTDPTLQYAVDGLARAQARQDLDAKIVNIIDNPRLLFDDRILAQARALIEQAEAVQEPGARISEQITSLTRLVNLASTPLTVRLQSDALTEVTVYRVGSLGTFTATEIDVRPGEYTAIGSRNGYRDVRLSFTVLPGQEIDPIRIVCVDPI